MKRIAVPADCLKFLQSNGKTRIAFQAIEALIEAIPCPAKKSSGFRGLSQRS